MYFDFISILLLSQNICDKYNETDFGRHLNSNQNHSNEDSFKARNDINQKIALKYSTDFWHQLKIVFWRSFLTISREPQITRIRIIQTLVLIAKWICLFYQDLNNLDSCTYNGDGLLAAGFGPERGHESDRSPLHINYEYVFFKHFSRH